MDGRFLLRRESNDHRGGVGRGLSKTEKKAIKEQAKKDKKVSKKRKSKKGSSEGWVGSGGVDTIAELPRIRPGSIARSLYHDMPESRLTRSISVKNHQQHLLLHSGHSRSSLQGDEFDGGDGTLRVYADSVLPDVPCKSLLVSSRDTAALVVRSTLEKYGLREHPSKFCLVQVTVPPIGGSTPHLNADYGVTEHILGDAECPLHIHSHMSSDRHFSQKGGSVQFQLRRRASFARRRSSSQSRSVSPEDDPTLPTLVEMFPDAQSPAQAAAGKKFVLSLTSTEIGSHVPILDASSYVCLTSPGVMPRHCAITGHQGMFRIVPLDKHAVIAVNDKDVKEPMFLPHNAVVRIGEREVFRFFAPVEMKQDGAVSMHTLPTNIGRQGGGAERHDPTGKTDNMSKAFSVEDMLNPIAQRGSGFPRGRAHSEFNLKTDGTGGAAYGGLIPEEGPMVGLVGSDVISTVMGGSEVVPTVRCGGVRGRS